MKSLLGVLMLAAVAASSLNMTANDRYQDPYVKGKSPRVGITEEEFLDYVHYYKALMDAIFDGLGFYEFLGNEEFCFDNIEIMLWYFYYSTEIIEGDQFEAEMVYNSTYSFTQGIY